jgi:hypothetical protein
LRKPSTKRRKVKKTVDFSEQPAREIPATQPEPSYWSRIFGGQTQPAAPALLPPQKKERHPRALNLSPDAAEDAPASPSSERHVQLQVKRKVETARRPLTASKPSLPTAGVYIHEAADSMLSSVLRFMGQPTS